MTLCCTFVILTRVQKVKRESQVPLDNRELMDWMALMGREERGDHQDHLLKWYHYVQFKHSC